MFDNNLSAYKNALQSEEKSAHTVEAGSDRVAHNLRHLFARTFYGIKKDIAKLADILSHAGIDTTRIYIVSTGTEHRRFMEKMRLIL